MPRRKLIGRRQNFIGRTANEPSQMGEMLPMGITSSADRQTHRKLPLSVQDGDERPALEDDLAGGETPARGDCLGLHSVGIVVRLLLHDRRMMNGGGAASACTSLMPARRRRNFSSEDRASFAGFCCPRASPPLVGKGIAPLW